MKEKFLIDFFDSLVIQTNNNFDLVVVNDGYLKFDKLKLKYRTLNIIELEYSNTPSKNREYGINYCIDNNYDVLIFGDSDDYFSDNRIEVSLKYLNTHDVFVNDFDLFDSNGVFIKEYISNRIENNTLIDYKFIKDKNIFGFSNSSINLHKVTRVSFDANLIAVDWYFFQEILLNGCNAIFSNKTKTYYRQHSNNKIDVNYNNEGFKLWWES